MSQDEVLDRLFIEYFQTLTELRELRVLLGESMKTGFWEMAKARIATMTNQQACSITPVHYDMNMKASIKVILSEEIQPNSLSFVPFSPDNTTASETLIPPASSSASSNNQLRHRKPTRVPATPTEDRLVESEESTTKSETPSAKKNLKDPLFWFGYAPPRSLRLSQQNFKQAVPYIARIAQLQTKMRMIEEKFQALSSSSSSSSSS